ncbi:MAG TPA: hypothetical protein VFC99_02505 [Acidimicrobiia bacterium]|nr:hypothetical protein [Acidimicrobiia bacterium]
MEPPGDSLERLDAQERAVRTAVAVLADPELREAVVRAIVRRTAREWSDDRQLVSPMV